MQNIGVGHRQNVSVLVLHMDDLRPGGSSSSYKKEFLLLHIIDKAMHSSFVTLITCNSVKNEDWCPLPSIYIFFFHWTRSSKDCHLDIRSYLFLDFPIRWAHHHWHSSTFPCACWLWCLHVSMSDSKSWRSSSIIHTSILVHLLSAY